MSSGNIGVGCIWFTVSFDQNASIEPRWPAIVAMIVLVGLRFVLPPALTGLHAAFGASNTTVSACFVLSAYRSLVGLGFGFGSDRCHPLRWPCSYVLCVDS